MKLFEKGVCPICQKETNAFNRTTIKHSDDYICQNCFNLLLKKGVSFYKIKELTLNELIDKVNCEQPICQEEVSKSVDKDEVKKQKSSESYRNMQQKKINRNTIVKTRILNNSTDSRKKVGSTVIRGAVGGSLLGPVGMLGGAMSGKNKTINKVTFLVEYADGHRETKIVENNSKEFKNLCNYLEM